MCSNSFCVKTLPRGLFGVLTMMALVFLLNLEANSSSSSTQLEEWLHSSSFF